MFFSASTMNNNVIYVFSQKLLIM